MPIYPYRCTQCGHAEDFLQKISDAPIASCPQCSSPEFHKQLTAAGFQLKGSGWYVTDFRDQNKKPDKPTENTSNTESSDPAQTQATPTKSEGAENKPAVNNTQDSSKKTESSSDSKTSSKETSPSPPKAETVPAKTPSTAPATTPTNSSS